MEKNNLPAITIINGFMIDINFIFSKSYFIETSGSFFINSFQQVGKFINN